MIGHTNVDGLNVTVTVEPQGGRFGAGIVGVGLARCRATDLFVPRIGEKIAAGRAIQDYGRRLEEAGLAESVSMEEVDRVLSALV